MSLFIWLYLCGMPLWCLWGIWCFRSSNPAHKVGVHDYSQRELEVFLYGKKRVDEVRGNEE